MDSDLAPHRGPICVLLVDDHPAVRRGLALLLASEGIDVCAEAAGSVEAQARLGECKPNVAIVDLSLDGEDGAALVSDLQRRNIHVLVYSMHSDARHVEDALTAGALGYVTKRDVPGMLVQAIREVAGGRRFVGPQAAIALAECVKRSTAPDELQKLSPHERQVYERLGEGQDTFEIAAALHISIHTVESYYSRILVKLNLRGMHELRRQAIVHLQKRTPW